MVLLLLLVVQMLLLLLLLLGIRMLLLLLLHNQMLLLLLMLLHQAALQRVVQPLGHILAKLADIEGLVLVDQLGRGQVAQRSQLVDGAVQVIAAWDAVRRRRQFGHKRRLVAAKGQRAVGDGASVQLGGVSRSNGVTGASGMEGMGMGMEQRYSSSSASRHSTTGGLHNSARVCAESTEIL